MLAAHDALEQLRAGNKRFVSGAQLGVQSGAQSGVQSDSRTSCDSSLAAIARVRPADVANDPKPIAIVLGCSDARVPPEIVFDQDLGALFVVRVAGNIVTAAQLGSIEIAATHFGIRLIVVLGHSRCAAIQSTIDALAGTRDGTDPFAHTSPGMRSILDRVRIAVDKVKETHGAHTDVEHAERAVYANIRTSVNDLCATSQVLEQMIDQEGLVVVGAHYAVGTGVVEFLDTACESNCCK